MTKNELIARLKTQIGELGMLVADIEASDTDALASTPVADLSPEQFAQLCATAMSGAMKPVLAATAEAAHKVIESQQFEDETERLSTGIRRSRSVVELADEDKGN
jgi:hypothetical protein